MDVTCGKAGFQEEVLRRVNQARSQPRACGARQLPQAGPLRWNRKLAEAAAGHAADMAANDYFSHASRDGRGFNQRIAEVGYAWSTIGENIAAGQGSVELVMENWLHSPGHCENLMNERYAEIGVACVRGEGTEYTSYWVMELGRRK
jgi:uncharacterized protein YkwD